MLPQSVTKKYDQTIIDIDLTNGHFFDQLLNVRVSHNILCVILHNYATIPN